MHSHDLMRLLIYYFVAAININGTAGDDVSITLGRAVCSTCSLLYEGLQLSGTFGSKGLGFRV